MHHTHLAGRRSLIAIFRKGNDVILEQGEDDLMVFRKLEVRAGVGKRSDLPKKAPAPPADPRHKQFIEAWMAAYSAHFRQPYTFNGPIDGKALKTFLAANHTEVPYLIKHACDAWKRQDEDPFCKACKQSMSVRGFCTSWNEIVAELTREIRNSQSNGSTFRL